MEWEEPDKRTNAPRDGRWNRGGFGGREEQGGQVLFDGTEFQFCRMKSGVGSW